MPVIMKRNACLSIFLLVFLCMNLNYVLAKKKTYFARKSDVKFIACEVCEELAKQLSRQYKKMKDEILPKKITELQVIGITEKVCDAKRNEGEWITKFDIVEAGDKLKLKEQSRFGECRTKCKTIQRACEDIMGDHDTDVAEAIYSGGSSRSAISKHLCRDLSKVCSKRPPPVPKDREPGEEFVFAEEDRVKMEKMMQELNDIPDSPKMKMYSRDELMKETMPGFRKSGDDDDEEEDEDEEEDDMSVNAALKRVLAKRKADEEREESAKSAVLDAPETSTTITDSILEKVGEVTGTVKAGAQQAVEAAKMGAKAASDWVGSLLGDKDSHEAEL